MGRMFTWLSPYCLIFYYKAWLIFPSDPVFLSSQYGGKDFFFTLITAKRYKLLLELLCSDYSMLWVIFSLFPCVSFIEKDQREREGKIKHKTKLLGIWWGAEEKGGEDRRWKQKEQQELQALILRNRWLNNN